MRRNFGWTLCFAALMLVPASATAQPVSATVTGNTDLARDWANKAKERFQGGDYAGAIEAIHEAEKHFRAPPFTRLAAQAHERLGKLVEARQLYQSLADVELGADAPPAWVTAREEGKKELLALVTRIPALRITVLGADVASLKVTLDGNALGLAQLGQLLPRNPGAHTVVVESAGRKRETREAQLKEGVTEQLVIELTASIAAPTVTVSPAITASVSVTPPPGPRSMVGPAIAFGVGGAGLVLGAIAGGLAVVKTGELRDLCGSDLVCPAATRGKADIEGANAMAHVSTAGFVLAGVGAAVGVVLLLLPGGERAELPHASVVVGPGFAGVKGTF